MRPLINKRKNLKMNYIRKFEEVQRFSSGSECDTDSKNVTILTIHFCKLITGFE